MAAVEEAVKPAADTMGGGDFDRRNADWYTDKVVQLSLIHISEPTRRH